jgi:hypothetical protein
MMEAVIQVIENLTQIEGTVTARRPHPSLDGYEMVTVRVDQVAAVEGFPSLIAAQPGDHIEIAIRSALLAPAASGAVVRLRAKRTPDGIMCEPHPRPGDFRIS